MSRKQFERPALFIAGLLVFSSSWTSAQIQRSLAPKSAQVETLRTDLSRSFEPVWNGNLLIGMELNRTSEPIIWAMDRGGSKEEIRFSIPEASDIIVWNLAASFDGTIAVGGLAVGGDSQGSGFLGIIPPDRSKKTIVRTWPYVPRAVTIAPDGVIWTVGWHVDDGQHQRIYNVLKRFDRSGTLLSSADLRVRSAIGGDASHGSILRSSKDRVGWLTAAFEYIEFSLDGRESARYEGPPWSGVSSSLFTTIAFHGEDVLAAAWGQGHSMWTLDRKNRSWLAVQVANESLDQWAEVFGFDGDDLVVGSAPGAGSLITVTRYHLSPQTPNP
jgi:hypothetical protein